MTNHDADDPSIEASLHRSLADRLRAVAESYEEMAELHRSLADLYERHIRAHGPKAES